MDFTRRSFLLTVVTILATVATVWSPAPAMADTCPKGGEHDPAGRVKTSKGWPVPGYPLCSKTLKSQTCSKCKSDITVEVEYVGVLCPSC